MIKTIGACGTSRAKTLGHSTQPLLRATSSPNPDGGEVLEMDRRIEAAIEIMRREPGGNLPVREIASKVRLSRWRFIHLFKAETKLTPKQFMVRIRMRRAEHLLQNSFLSIKEIAAEAGFADPSHFSRECKRHWGVSPSQIRERQRRAG
jgi:AraC family transcriptional regulator